ncbi:MAG: hypothetical protein J0M37_12380 [Ignavibacteria bacterium]|nr:hypothetical protein [Ignavibacteria bacterium]
MKIRIPVSPGELIDKITILEIKRSRIKEKTKLSAVKEELLQLTALAKKYSLHTGQFKLLTKKLYNVNLKLWITEDKIRKKEAIKKFDGDFIKLARAVYITNDKRSEIKNKINLLAGSSLKEIKQYTEY